MVGAVFQESILADQLLKGILGDEIIMDAIHLIIPGGTGSGRHGKEQAVTHFHHTLQHRTLANTGRTGNDKQLSFAHSFSSSFSFQRSPMASGVRADRITWSVSIRITALVFRP